MYSTWKETKREMVGIRRLTENQAGRCMQARVPSPLEGDRCHEKAGYKAEGNLGMQNRTKREETEGHGMRGIARRWTDCYEAYEGEQPLAKRARVRSGAER